MSGIFDPILRWQRRRKREQRVAQARQWPMATGEVNHWEVVQADEEYASTATPYQVEAGFHFKVNGEYFGGYLRSVALTHHEAEMQAKGDSPVQVRYNPADPDEAAVLAEDNAALPFRIVSG